MSFGLMVHALAGMIIAGGWTNENLKDVWFYRFASDTWHRLADLPYAVRGIVLSCFPRTIY